MSIETLVIGERKYRRGVASVFEWVAPGPVNAASGAPSLTVTRPGPGGTSYVVALSVIHADLAVGVSGMANDMRTLTITAAVNTDGLQGRYGVAQLITPDEGVFPVLITRIAGTSVSLAEQIPRKLALATGATLQFSTYTGTIPAATIAATVERGMRWTVTYAEQHGTNAPILTGQRDMGLMHIVEQPFSTGLTQQLLQGFVNGLGETAPRMQQSWAPQIQAGGHELILELRKHLASLSLTEDNLPAPQLLQSAHVSFCLAAILDLTSSDQADRFRAQARERVDTALRNSWLDLNADAIVDPSEEEAHVTAPLFTEMAPATFSTPTFLGRR